MEFRFRKGRDIRLGSSVGQAVVAQHPLHTVALMAQDFPGVTFDLRVAEGAKVLRGQTLCVDRQRPEIAFVASLSGRVSDIRIGPRRRIEAIEITAESDGDGDATFAVDAAHKDDAALRALLLQSGAWAAFRTRPFGGIPDPADRSSAIFVTATDSNPLAPDPAQVLAPMLDSFRRGAAALLRLTEGPVFVCQTPGAPLIEAHDRLRLARFSGPHPSGLAGTHIHHLWPVSRHRTVWQIGYQEVAALGDLLATGRITAERTIAVAGPGVSAAAMLCAPLGARLADILGAVGDISGLRLVSGSVLSGDETLFLRRHDLQVTVLPRPAARPGPLWRSLNRLQPKGRTATIPSETFERVFPFDILPVPLMRALAVGDVETAERLGSLELLEEDLALLSWRCPSGSDYGKLLRHVLDDLKQEQAA